MPRYAISSRARSTAPAPLQRCANDPPGPLAVTAGRRGEGYDTTPAHEHHRACWRWYAPDVLLATSAAVSKDVGLIATFGGIGVIVNVIIVFIAIQVRGERRQNDEYRERLLDR